MDMLYKLQSINHRGFFHTKKIMVVTFTTFIDNNFYKVQYSESDSHVRILLGTDFNFIPTSDVHHEFYETEWHFFQSTTTCLCQGPGLSQRVTLYTVCAKTSVLGPDYWA